MRERLNNTTDFTQGWPGIYYIKMLGQLLGRSFFSRFQTDKNTTHKKIALEKPWNQLCWQCGQILA